MHNSSGKTPIKKSISFRAIRIAILLAILIGVALSSYLQQRAATDWRNTLIVKIYPINGDQSELVASYIDNLSADRFNDIENFLTDQAARYGVNTSPLVKVELGPKINAMPPMPPESRNNPLLVVPWSLNLRYWAFKHARDKQGKRENIRIFVLYHEAREGRALDHSLGLQQGLLGVVHAFAEKEQDNQNNVIIAHEILHTVGATDKYDSSGYPIFPDGFADSEKNPPHPQTAAEIMGGRIPLSKNLAIIPPNLKACVIGPKTAHEIHLSNAWKK